MTIDSEGRVVGAPAPWLTFPKRTAVQHFDVSASDRVAMSVRAIASDVWKVELARR